MMRFVQPKTIDQQDIQLLHRVRSRLVSQRTSLCNQMRGVLAEYGIVIKQGITQLRKQIHGILDDAENGLSPKARTAFAHTYEELLAIDQRVNVLSKGLAQLSDEQSRCKQFKSVYGIGPMTATALYTAMGDPKHYKNGREFAAFFRSGAKTIQYRGKAETQ